MRLFLRITLAVFLVLLLAFGGLILFLKTEKGKTWLNDQVFSYASEFLKTEVTGEVGYAFPDYILLENFLLKDQKKDSLLVAQRLFVDMDVWGLLHSRVEVNAIELQGFLANIKREKAEKDFNYSFLLEAFASDSSKTDTSAAGLRFDIKRIDLNDFAVKYRDHFLGNSANLKLGELHTGFRQLDLDHSIYDLEDIRIAGLGLAVDWQQNEPVEDSTKVEEPTDSAWPKIGLKQVLAEQINWHVNFAPQKIASSSKVDRFEMDFDRFDLEKERIKLTSVALVAPFLKYDDLSEPRQKQGLDFGHLDLTDLRFSAENIEKQNNSLAALIRELAVQDLSGFGIKKLSGDLQYGEKQLTVENFDLATNYSDLQANLDLNYGSQEELMNDWANAEFELACPKGHFALQDLFYFQPDVFEEPNLKPFRKESVDFKGQLSGTLQSLTVDSFVAEGLKGSRLNFSGKAYGLVDFNDNTKLDLHLNHFGLKQEVFDLFLADSLKQAYGLPKEINLKGDLSGKLADFQTDLNLDSDLGALALNANFQDVLSEKQPPHYKGELQMDKFLLNRLLKNDSLPQLSMYSEFDGKGFDFEQMELLLKGRLNNAKYNGFGYEQIDFDSHLEAQRLSLNLNSVDSENKATIVGDVQFTNAYPLVDLKGEFNKIDLQKLGLYSDPLALGTRFAVEFTNSNPDSLNGEISLQATHVELKGKPYLLGDSKLSLSDKNGAKLIGLESAIADAKAEGRFSYSDLPNAILSKINTYFYLTESDSTAGAQQFDLSLTLKKNPLIQELLPELQDFKPMQFDFKFDEQSASPIVADVSLPYTVYDSIGIRGVALHLDTQQDKAIYSGSLGELKSGDFRLRKLNLEGSLADQNLQFGFHVKDSVDQEIHRILGHVKQADSSYTLSLNREGNVFFYKDWQTDGSLRMQKDGLVFNAFTLQSGRQQIALQTFDNVGNGPIDLDVHHVDLNEWSRAIMQDEHLLAGELNAGILLQDWDKELKYEGYFQIDKLTVQDVNLGDLVATASNETANSIKLRADLNGKLNQLSLDGTYLLNSKEDLDLVLDISQLSAQTLKAFSFGEIKEAEGLINGKLTISGKTEKPIVRGELGFDRFAIVPTQLGSKLSIDQQKMQFKGQYLYLEDFRILDSEGQPLSVDGRILFPDLPNFSYQLHVKADNFEAVNAAAGSNDYFYGKASVNTNMMISGRNEVYEVSGDVEVVEGSHLYLLIPDDELASSEMTQVVTFVDRSAIKKDSSKVENKPIMPPLAGVSTFDLNLKVDDKSQLTLVLDELTEDYFHLKGNAKLRMGIDANDDIFIYGDYVISEGNYEFVFEGIKKMDFKVRNGSFIRWSGDPYNAEVNIITEFRTQARLYDYISTNSVALSSNTLEQSKRQVPVLVLLRMENTLADLKSYFEIGVTKSDLEKIGISEFDNLNKVGLTIVDNEKNVVQSPKQSVLTQKENNINRQAFSLLVIGRFFPDEGLDAGSTSGLNAEAIARKQASKILSDELEKLASGILKGVDLDVGVASEYTAETGDRSTQVNLGVSKAFFNDRVSVSVGRNFELEDAQRQSSEVFDNISAQYKLSEDGKFLFKVYRKNQYQTVIEGFVVETGLGFSMVFEFDKLFGGKKHAE
ncbi:translocation/assembly module TamB domain-containing protein [Marinilongibacter aquaticus]|uniref:translocation/assembly module TamB domain-containing protein n=1 Tax=Marinilongibacter aquaticus TaxID=2975157 RepID=UPI0021BDCE20|nr:translocation/assembly module TamB domain-containing protein [Marinilongibacter aquaticus]UBM58965.1 translocation/assembly module TamB domain-containing protein [Marinilongibacter aquaticus]